jgi:hypothetical protein
LWRHLHMFLDILEFRLQTNKDFLGQTVLRILSQNCPKKTDVSTKLLLEKSEITKTN